MNLNFNIGIFLTCTKSYILVIGYLLRESGMKIFSSVLKVLTMNGTNFENHLIMNGKLKVFHGTQIKALRKYFAQLEFRVSWLNFSSRLTAILRSILRVRPSQVWVKLIFLMGNICLIAKSVGKQTIEISIFIFDS